MKKRAMIIGITGVVLMFCAVSPTSAALNYQEMYQSSTGSQEVLLVVNSAIYEPIETSLNQYIMDLEAEDYNLTVMRFISGTPDDLKSYMKTMPGLKGVVLIGDMPVAKFLVDRPYRRIFPTDFFYMDLDGEWIDWDKDGIYDGVVGGSSGLEIWLGRLPAHLVTQADMDEVGLLRNYFAKNHSYRTGKLSLPHRALLYTEFGYSSSSQPTLKEVYSDLTVVTDPDETNAFDYKERLKQGYEWIHLSAHGGGGFHVFSGGFVSSSDIRDIDPKTHFYTVDSCYCCDFTERDYIGVYYIFSKTNGLATVGYTDANCLRTDFEHFYHNLNQTKRKSIGEAFQNWLDYVDSTFRFGLRQFPEDYFDKTVLGDPTLSVDPPIASIDYISPSSAKPGNLVTFRGSGKINSGSITAYSWRSSINGHLSNYSSFSTSSLSPGVHKIYFKVKDNNGRWSSEVTETIAVGEIVFNLNLSHGWNLISLPIEPYDTDIVTVLKCIEGLWIAVIGEYGSCNSDISPSHWSLKTMEHGKGYRIKVGGETILPVAGKQIYNTAIQLFTGWNWVGYNSLTPQPLEEALSSIAGLCEAVIGEFGAYNSAYHSYSSLKTMEPGKGYRIKVKKNCVWDIAPSEPERPLLPTLDPVSSLTNKTPQKISGTKEPYTSIWINGYLEVNNNENITWSCEVKLEEGENIFFIIAKDTLGNESKSQIISIELDTIPPEIIISSPPNNSYINQLQVILEGTVDGQFFTEIRQLPQEGENILDKEAIDRAGNEASASITVVRDTLSPEVIISSPQGGFYTNQTSIEVVYRIDGIEYRDTEELTREGENTITREAQDKAGNTGSASITVIRDTVKPEVIITSPKDKSYTNQLQIALSGTIDGQGFSEVRALSQEGENILTKEATDRAGNKGSASVKVIRDTIAPQIIITSPQNGSYTNKLQVTLEGTVDGVGFSETRQLLQEGENILIKEAEDEAGNEGSDSIKVILDMTKPTSWAEPKGDAYNSSQKVTLQATEKATIYYTTDGSLPTQSSNIYSTPIDINDDTLLRFLAVDLAGNGDLSYNQENYIIIYAPEVGDIPDVSFPEDTSNTIVDLDDYVTDLDHRDSQLNWTYKGNVNIGVDIDSSTHIVTFSAPKDWNGGPEGIAFTATDSDNASDSDSVSVTVTPRNDAPVSANDSYTVNEGDTINKSAPGVLANDTDVENDTLTVTLVTNVIHGSLTLTSNGSFTYIHDGSETTQDTFTYKANDGTIDSNIATVTLTINPVNDAPEADDQTVTTDEDTPVDVALTGSDIEGANLTYKIVDLPVNGTLTGTVPKITYTPGPNYNGKDTFTFTVNDSTVNSTPAAVTIQIAPVNDPPELDGIGYKRVDEDKLLEIFISATDVDGDIPTLKVTNSPEGAEFVDKGNGTGLFKWTPTYEDAGVYNNVRFEVKDRAGLTDYKYIDITVNNVNRLPRLVIRRPSDLKPIEDADKIIPEGEKREFILTATDEDKEDSLTCFASNLPRGSSFYPKSQIFTWTPDFTQAGEYKDILFEVSDVEDVDQEYVTFTVTHVNQPPVLNSIGDKFIKEGQVLEFKVSAEDIDGDKLTYSASNLPPGATFDPDSQIFNWQPDFAQAGTYTGVHFEVTDDEFIDTEDITITVSNTNLAPIIEDIPEQNVTEGETVEFTIVAHDPDGTNPEYSVYNLPDTAIFDSQLLTFTWQPGHEDIGRHKVIFSVTDGDLINSHIVTIIVSSLNQVAAYGHLAERMDIYSSSGSRLIESYSEPYPLDPTGNPALQGQAFIYDNALASIAFLSRGLSEDIERARNISQCFIDLQDSDSVDDGRIKDCYYANVIPHTVSNGGTHAGNMGWAIISLLQYYKNSGDEDTIFLEDILESAKEIGNFVISNFKDDTQPGFFIGFDSEYDTYPNPNKSTEHNIALYVAFMHLYDVTGDSLWKDEADWAKQYAISKFNGEFFTAGTGDEYVEDANSLALLGLGQKDTFTPALSWVETNMAVTHHGFCGFDFDDDKDGVWFEGTGQMALAYQIVGREASSNFYLEELRRAQTEAIGANGKAITSACHSRDEQGNVDGVSAIWFDYFASPHIGATSWFILAERESNPLYKIATDELVLPEVAEGEVPTPQVYPVTSPTNIPLQTISGIKSAETSIWLNGREIVPLNSGEVFSYTVSLTAGENPLRFTAKNREGIESTPTNATIILDTVAPIITITSPADGLLTNNSTITVSGRIEGDASTVEVNGVLASIDRASFTAVGVKLVEGTNAILAVAKDKAGNTSRDTITVYLDSTAPAAPQLAPYLTLTNVPIQILSGTKSADSSVWLNGKKIVPFGIDTEWSYDILLKEGPNTLSFTSKDDLRNESEPLEISIELDTIPPDKPTIDSDSVSSPTNIETQTITGTMSLDADEIIIFSSTAIIGSVTYPRPTAWRCEVFLQEGYNALTVFAEDLVGNRIMGDTVTIVLDTEAPLFEVIYPRKGSFINGKEN